MSANSISRQSASGATKFRIEFCTANCASLSENIQFSDHFQESGFSCLSVLLSSIWLSGNNQRIFINSEPGSWERKFLSAILRASHLTFNIWGWGSKSRLLLYPHDTSLAQGLSDRASAVVTSGIHSFLSPKAVQIHMTKQPQAAVGFGARMSPDRHLRVSRSKRFWKLPDLQ
jgi:hypothetical protein